MTRREPSLLAKSAAASISLVALVVVVAHAQWGCDRRDSPAGADAATQPAPVTPAAEPASSAAPASAVPSVEAEPAAEPAGRTDAQAPPNPVPQAAVPPVANAPSAPADARPQAPARRKSRAGADDSRRNRRSRYISSTKSDPDMWSGLAGFEATPSANANEPPPESSAR